jgi:hypothetical protein
MVSVCRSKQAACIGSCVLEWNRSATVEKTDADFNTSVIQFRGYIDFGVREQDYRGAVKIKGEA